MSLASAPAGLWPRVRPAEFLNLDTPSRELRLDAARDRRIGRDESCGLARRFEHFAHGDGQRQGLFVFVVGDDHRNAFERVGDCGRRQGALPIAPAVSRFGGAERFAQKCSARRKRRRTRAEDRDVVASDADHADQPVQQRLRMACEPLRGVVACADHRPGALVQVAVEVRQNHRALWGARNRRDEAGGRAIGAGRSGNDGRAASRSLRERLDFALDQKRDPLRPVNQAALGEPLRPMREGNSEKVEGNAPRANHKDRERAS